MSDSRYHTPDEEYKIAAFKILSDGNLDPEDDPAKWIYPEAEDAELRKLAEDIVAQDKLLARILADTASGEKSTGETLRVVCASMAMMGGGHKRAKGAVASEPWLA